MIKKTVSKEGYVNRHATPLPTQKTNMYIITNDFDGEHEYLCEWLPYSHKNAGMWAELPGKGYLGTARTFMVNVINRGFDAWEQNDSEFVLYKIVN